MQREDVERMEADLLRLAYECDEQDEGWEKDGPMLRDAVVALRTLLAERNALRAAIFGGTDYATDLTNGNFVEMAQTTETARLGALDRAERAETERDAAFAAGQEDMQERAIQDVAEWGCLFLGSGENVTVDVIDDLRDLPIKPRP